MGKIGRNAPCPCGGGKKYKHCHGAPLPAETVRVLRQGTQIPVKLLEFQRRRQQGLARRIMSSWTGDRRLVTVGRRRIQGRWLLFTDFLHDYIKLTLGTEWGNAELTKSPNARHPVIGWYGAIAELQKRHFSGPGMIAMMPGHGAAVAYLGLAYDLYTIEHNTDSAPEPAVWERLLHRLRHPDQFVGARYELRVAAMLVRAGFVLAWEDETSGLSTHGEFIATYNRTGRQFWVECKMRQPGGSKEVGKGLGKFVSLVASALRKTTDHQRLVFVDLNTPAKPRPRQDASTWRDWAIGQLRKFEDSQEGKSLPSALVVVTNYPEHHHLGELIPDAGAAFEGFKMEEFRSGVKIQLHDAIERRKRNPELHALIQSMAEHSVIPTTWDGEIPELIGVENRLMIGRRFELAVGEVGILADACLDEGRQEAAAFLHMNSGTSAVYRVPLRSEEVDAWRRYPETFLGEFRPPNRTSNNALDLYDFFLSSLGQTPTAALVERLGGGTDLDSLSRDELAQRWAEGMVAGAAQTSGGFPVPEWADRLRPPPRGGNKKG